MTVKISVGAASEFSQANAHVATCMAKIEKGARMDGGRMPLMPVGSVGEPHPDLLIKKPQTIANCEDYRKSKWDMPYHQ